VHPSILPFLFPSSFTSFLRSLVCAEAICSERCYQRTISRQLS
jgi:hypothetical protein